MSQGYDGLPPFYLQSSDPITANLGLSLKGMDPIVAEDFYLIDAAFGSVGGSVSINGVSVPSPNFVNSASVTFAVVGSNISLTAGSSGVFPITFAAVAHEWLNSYNAVTGLFTATQPAYTDISGTPQLPQTLAPVANTFLTGYNATTGLFSAAAVVAGVSSVSNSDGTLTISPTTGVVVASLALGHANSWSGTQTFNLATITQLTTPDITSTAGLTVSAGTTLEIESGGTIFFDPDNAANDTLAISSGKILTGSGGIFGWASTAEPLTTADTAFSRASAGVVDLGTGAAGNAGGTLNLTGLTASGTIAANGGSITSTTGLTISSASGTNLTLSALGSASLLFDVASTQLFQLTTGVFRAGSAQVIGWSSAVAPSGGVADTGLSRTAAGVLAIGTGAAASVAGNLRFNRINTSGTDLSGQATITAASTTKAVTFTASYTTTAQPIVVVTPTSDPLAAGVPVGYWVTYSGSAGAWTGFTINIQTALLANVVFNYIVIGQA
jgi:hypothetical protein